MNMLLLKKRSNENVYKVEGVQFNHVINHLKLGVSQTLVVGILNETIGVGEILSVGEQYLTLKIISESQPPVPAKLKLIMAIPRPKVFKRVLKHVITFGVKEIYLINSWTVEKSFLKSSLIENSEFEQYIYDALEQCVDTIPPTIKIYHRFKPFVEDVLPTITKGIEKYIAHPKSENLAPYSIKEDSIIAIGPDRGFTAYELKMFEEQGFQGVTLGNRILHQESAIPFIIGRLL